MHLIYAFAGTVSELENDLFMTRFRQAANALIKELDACTETYKRLMSENPELIREAYNAETN